LSVGRRPGQIDAVLLLGSLTSAVGAVGGVVSTALVVALETFEYALKFAARVGRPPR
jgi:hypothetical protein